MGPSLNLFIFVQRAAKEAKKRVSKNGPGKKSMKNRLEVENGPAADPTPRGSEAMGKSPPKGGVNPAHPRAESPPSHFSLSMAFQSLSKPGPKIDLIFGRVFLEMWSQFGPPDLLKIVRNHEK